MAAADPTPADKSQQVATHPVAAADSVVARTAYRLSVQYILRSLRLMVGEGGYDLITSIVLQGVTAGNVGHLDQDPNHPSPYGDIEHIAPDETRRPISVLALANTLGLPYETTRRHVAKLVADGYCVRVKGGVIATAGSQDEPRHRQGLLTNVANLRRLYRGLKRLGFDED